jgi:LacI family transcriptional regulator
VDTKPQHLTIHDVAAAAGVSTATVTRVLRDDPRVALPTRQRVRAIVSQLGYQVNAVAQSLRTKQIATVAHILSGLFPNPFSSNVARGLQEEATKLGYEVLVYSSEDSPRVETEVVQAAIRRRVDAVIFTTPVNADNVVLAGHAGARVVQVERSTGAPSITVRVDNYCGGREAVELLLSLGHRDIAFIGLDPDRATDGSIESARLNAYLDALQQVGARPRVLLGQHYVSDVASFQTPGRLYIEEILATDTTPTAVFAASDLLAAGALQILYARGLRVPDDISVVGFDDTYAASLTPPLTTVAVPMRELGQAALRCAVGASLEDHVELKSQLVVRESTGSPTRRQVASLM